MVIGTMAGAVSDGVARTHAIVNAPATASMSGTASRSARATACGPRHTTSVASTPSTSAHGVWPAKAGPSHDDIARAHADAAITLLSAIHAKLDT